MIGYEFKGGMGTSSRCIEILGNSYAIDALVDSLTRSDTEQINKLGTANVQTGRVISDFMAFPSIDVHYRCKET
jgi:hypothetical protein